MEVERLILPFLGRRNYLHGTTLFDALLPLAPADGEIVFKFAQMIRSNCVGVNTEAGDASFSWKSGNSGSATLHISPLAPAEPLERRAYPEKLIAEQAVVEGKSARYRAESPFSLVATLIPLHKALLAANVAPSAPGQWVFTRLDLRRRSASFESVELRLAGVFQEQLARSTVVIEGQESGTIYFSWLPTP